MLVLKQLDFLGDPVMLHLLIQQKKFNVNNIDNLPEERLKEICKECSISTNRRSVVSVFLFCGWVLTFMVGSELKGYLV